MSKLFAGMNLLRGNKSNKNRADGSQKLSETSQSSASTTRQNSLAEGPSHGRRFDHMTAPTGLPTPLPLWLDPTFASKHIVKGNLMTLNIRPKAVEEGEWMAHQVVEQYRNLLGITLVVSDNQDGGSTICNPSTCPKMSAGKNHSYVWPNVNNNGPDELSAQEYITLVQRWISAMIEDPNLFPTNPSGVCHEPLLQHSGSTLLTSKDEDWLGKRSGFPKEFQDTCRSIYRQMFRVYAHIYWHHFIEPFYHLQLEGHLNSLFSHFILSAHTLDMLQDDELAPMRPLIDLWTMDGTLPQSCKIQG